MGNISAYLTEAEAASALSVNVQEISRMIEGGDLAVLTVAPGEVRIPRSFVEQCHLKLSTRSPLIMCLKEEREIPRQTTAKRNASFLKATGTNPKTYLDQVHAGQIDVTSEKSARLVVEAEELYSLEHGQN